MRLVSRKWNELMKGEAVELIPDDAEDTWHLYNLIQPGDFVAGKTTRKVAKLDRGKAAAADDANLPKSTERMVLDVTLSVTGTSYDPHTGALRITGRNLRESDFIPIGASQSIDVQMNISIRMGKAEGWDSVSEEMLNDALNPERAGDGGIAAVVLDEQAAHICLITPHRTILRVKVSADKSKKAEASKKATISTATAPNPYFERTLATLLRSFDFSNPRPLILAGPGFTAQNLKSYMATASAGDKDTKFLKALVRETKVIPTSSGSLHGLNAVMGSPEMQAAMEGMRFVQESTYLDRFMEVYKLDDGRAHYGVRTVTKAVEEGAVGQGKGLLLMSNALFRSKDLAERKKFVALVDTVKAAGGEVRILSSEHEAGKRLAMLGNVAAVLNYPLPDLDDDEAEEEEEARRQEEEQARRRAEERRREVDVEEMF